MAALTSLNDIEVNKIFLNYDLGDLMSVFPLNGGQANTSYKVTTTRGVYTLSVCDEKSIKDLENLVCILDHLEKHHYPSTKLLRTITGKSYIVYMQKPVVIREFIHGKVVSDLNGQKIKQIGEVIAQLHRVPTPKCAPTGYAINMDHFTEIIRQKPSHSFITWLREKMEYFHSEIDFSIPQGFIHGDIFWDNLVFENDTLRAVLDFEEACHYYFIFDLTMAAVGCCCTFGHFDNEKINSLLHGYHQKRQLSQLEKSQFIPFLTYTATVAAFWRFQQYNIRHPNSKLANSYQELSNLADNPPCIDWK